MSTAADELRAAPDPEPDDDDNGPWCRRQP